jgi:hypothetical protein
MYKMKQVSVLLAAVFAISSTAFAQANFSGSWELDKSKSKLEERSGKLIEGQTLIVAQTASSLTVEVKTKMMSPSVDGMEKPTEMPKDGMKPPTADGKPKPPEMSKDVMMKPNPIGAEGLKKGGETIGSDNDGTITYSLDGKETKTQEESTMGSVPLTCKAKLGKDGTLQLSQTRIIDGPSGKITVSTTENWTLSADGKTLIVKKETGTPNGKTSSESVYEKENDSSPKTAAVSATEVSPVDTSTVKSKP